LSRDFLADAGMVVFSMTAHKELARYDTKSTAVKTAWEKAEK